MSRRRWSVGGLGRSRWAITNTTLFREIFIGCVSSCIGCDDCGEPSWPAAVSVGRCSGSGILRFLIAGFLFHGCCILIPSSASPPVIQGKSRMRQPARTDLCGGRPAMVVPTATRSLAKYSWGRIYPAADFSPLHRSRIAWAKAHCRLKPAPLLVFSRLG